MTDFEEIYNLYFRDVYRFVYKLSGSESIAEEITQEMFFKALKGIKNFNGKCSLKAWLFQIAKNVFYTHHKKQNRFDPLPETTVQNDKSVEDLVTDQASAMALHAALYTLAEPYKEVFMLRIFGELSFSQIGQVFGKTENWARVTFYRAKQKTLEQIGGHYA